MSYMSDYMLNRYHQRRQKIIEKLGGCCVKCGSTENLEIDHIDRSSKEIDIARCLSGIKESKLKQELDKCQLLCQKCHNYKTFHESRFDKVHTCKCGESYIDRAAYLGHKRWCQ